MTNTRLVEEFASYASADRFAVKFDGIVKRCAGLTFDDPDVFEVWVPVERFNAAWAAAFNGAMSTEVARR